MQLVKLQYIQALLFRMYPDAHEEQAEGPVEQDVHCKSIHEEMQLPFNNFAQ